MNPVYFPIGLIFLGILYFLMDFISKIDFVAKILDKFGYFLEEELFQIIPKIYQIYKKAEEIVGNKFVSLLEEKEKKS